MTNSLLKTMEEKVEQLLLGNGQYYQNYTLPPYYLIEFLKKFNFPRYQLELKHALNRSSSGHAELSWTLEDGTRYIMVTSLRDGFRAGFTFTKDFILKGENIDTREVTRSPYDEPVLPKQDNDDEEFAGPDWGNMHMPRTRDMPMRWWERMNLGYGKPPGPIYEKGDEAFVDDSLGLFI